MVGGSVNLHCPLCHGVFSLEALIQDQAGRDLLLLLAAKQPAAATALLSYLTLFRTGKRQLDFAKALKLAREVEELAASDPARMQAALSAVVDAMRGKQEEGTFTPFKNHKYLERTVKDTPALKARVETVAGTDVPGSALVPAGRLSKTAAGIGKLQGRKG
jgi:hypothetical protein